VLAFDTGALSELVQNNAGAVVPYGGNHWKLDPPDIPALIQAALPILEHNSSFRKAARHRAEEAFDLDDMTRAYLEVLLG
jgi:glycosyltransferase involved in cell wall biosynthesis